MNNIVYKLLSQICGQSGTCITQTSLDLAKKGCGFCGTMCTGMSHSKDVREMCCNLTSNLKDYLVLGTSYPTKDTRL